MTERRSSISLSSSQNAKAIGFKSSLAMLSDTLISIYFLFFRFRGSKSPNRDE